MKKISNDTTHFFRFIWPWVYLLATGGMVTLLIADEIYIMLFVVIPLFLLGAIANRFFYINRNLCNVYLDLDNKLFGINDYKSSYTIPVTELKNIKTHTQKRFVELVFADKIIYFMPITDILLTPSKGVMITLYKILHDQKKV